MGETPALPGQSAGRNERERPRDSKGLEEEPGRPVDGGVAASRQYTIFSDSASAAARIRRQQKQGPRPGTGSPSESGPAGTDRREATPSAQS